MKAICLCVVAALVVSGCAGHKANPPTAQAPIAYSAKNMAEFDASAAKADDHCYKDENLMRAQYMDRTLDSANFQCVAR
ncbi:MAG TPA: hypothetical protein VLV76_12935 [Candidatus Acidoferrum sp.]|nr:hypothetical protein [Candidatus Acidoferrum sp.]